MYRPITTPEARDRAEAATKVLLAIEIAFGALAFWSDAFASAKWQHFVVAFMLTAGFGAISALASTVVSRLAEAKEHKLTRALVGFSGLVLILVSGGMTWHGLAWADGVANLAPAGLDWILPVAAYGLSALNVIALYAFTREIRRKAELVVITENPKTVAARAMANARWEEERRKRLTA